MRRSLPVLSRPLWRSASNRPRPPGKVLSTRSTKSRVGGTDFGGVGGVCNLFQNTRRSAFNQAGCRQGREGGGGGGGGGRALAAGRCRRSPQLARGPQRCARLFWYGLRDMPAARPTPCVQTCAIGEGAQGHAPRADCKQAFWGAILTIMRHASGAIICRLIVPARNHQTPKARESRARHLDQRPLCLWLRA